MNNFSPAEIGKFKDLLLAKRNEILGSDNKQDDNPRGTFRRTAG